VQFQTGSAKILPNSYPILDEVVRLLKVNLDITMLSVEGHTDNRGSDALNEKLSADRAKSCVDYLVSKGIEASRLTSSGFGPRKPIDDNNTAPGRQKNRRTEFHIKNKLGGTDTPGEPAPPPPKPGDGGATLARLSVDGTGRHALRVELGCTTEGRMRDRARSCTRRAGPLAPRAVRARRGPPSRPSRSRRSRPSPRSSPMAGGCRAREGQAFRCTCSFLSDYDDDWEHSLVACGDGPEHAASVARGCAQASAPAPIQHCRCAPAPELPPCRNETCDEATASGGFVKR
jgi:hypothetical protein